jgi:hypothetical protein
VRPLTCLLDDFLILGSAYKRTTFDLFTLAVICKPKIGKNKGFEGLNNKQDFAFILIFTKI